MDGKGSLLAQKYTCFLKPQPPFFHPIQEGGKLGVGGACNLRNLAKCSQLFSVIVAVNGRDQGGVAQDDLCQRLVKVGEGLFERNGLFKPGSDGDT